MEKCEKWLKGPNSPLPVLEKTSMYQYEFLR